MKEDFNEIISESFETLEEFSEVFSFIALLKECLPKSTYENLVVDLFQFEEPEKHKFNIDAKMLEKLIDEIDNMNSGRYYKKRKRYTDEYGYQYESRDEMEYNRYLKYMQYIKDKL